MTNENIHMNLEILDFLRFNSNIFVLQDVFALKKNQNLYRM